MRLLITTGGLAAACLTARAAAQDAPSVTEPVIPPLCATVMAQLSSVKKGPYGIAPGNGAKNITITHSYIRTADDNGAIKGSKGGLTNRTVSHNHFYGGHGTARGSETHGGVSTVRVFDLTLDGTDAGIRTPLPSCDSRFVPWP